MVFFLEHCHIILKKDSLQITHQLPSFICYITINSIIIVPVNCTIAEETSFNWCFLKEVPLLFFQQIKLRKIMLIISGKLQLWTSFLSTTWFKPKKEHVFKNTNSIYHLSPTLLKSQLLDRCLTILEVTETCTVHSWFSQLFES